jgi:hypothetical protein
MKKILLVLLFAFLPLYAQSQTISEKLLCKFDDIDNIDTYSLKFDDKTGSYIYVYYDSTKELKNSIRSNKGNSADYDYINSYGVIFDAEGNYFLVVDIKINDSTYRNTLLKNGKEILNCEYINADLLVKDGSIYTVCTENKKSYVMKYDISSGNISKGKLYDEVIPCLYGKVQMEGEPIGKLGFTKEDKIFYLAKLNNESFIVTGDEEQKHYSDIDSYNILVDKSGRFSFVAKDTGSFMYSTDAFVVQGDKRYRTFNSIYNLMLDPDDNVIYVAGDSGTYTSPQRIMKNDKAISKTYSGGAYYLNFTPSGKLYYIANEKKKNSDDYEAFVVFDGKEGKKFTSINNLQVLSGDEVVYTVQNNDDPPYVVFGDREIKGNKKQNFIYADMLKDRKTAYLSVEYGNYEKNIKDKYLLYIDGDKFGPYDGMMVLNYENQSYLLSDAGGNYAYVVYNIKDNYDYRYILYTNKGKGKEFDNISDVCLYKGKAIYTGSTLTDKINYTYKYRIFYGDKSITPEYDAVSDFKFDDKTGIATYTIAKDKGVYNVEIKF